MRSTYRSTFVLAVAVLAAAAFQPPADPAPPASALASQDITISADSVPVSHIFTAAEMRMPVLELRDSTNATRLPAPARLDASYRVMAAEPAFVTAMPASNPRSRHRASRVTSDHSMRQPPVIAVLRLNVARNALTALT